MDVSLFSPAKINLILAVTGRRADGYHELLSVVAPLDFGDHLEARSREQGAGSQISLECDHPEVPVDGTNLILKAAAAFSVATGWKAPVHFRLTKRIPPGAGLGGGSSNAVAALRALNQLSGGRLDEAQLTGIAASLGSDCALFLANAPSVMRGRGERVEPLPAGVAARLRGRRVLLFKPAFSISTPWAYQRMMARGDDYLPAAEGERLLADWQRGHAPVEDLLFNNMEPAVDEKYLALPVLREKLRREHGLTVRMSGSGSACYTVLGDPAQAGAEETVTRIKQTIRTCWGAGAFVQAARLV
jgi:4-diphosphocytidyl-2-C-methyl-D-erythritol kinase